MVKGSFINGVKEFLLYHIKAFKEICQTFFYKPNEVIYLKNKNILRKLRFWANNNTKIKFET